MKELVSIVMPAYNSERFIKDSIQSVIDQDYTNWELLIIDDGSKDNTKNIVKEYLNLESRIRLIALDENRGVANARNVGIKEARGRYIAFLDSDDMWYPNKLSRQLQFMQENDFAFTFTSYEIIDEHGERVNKVIRAPHHVDYRELLKGNIIGCLTVVIDRDTVGSFLMPNTKHEDYATWLEVTKRGFVAYGINEVLALYRRSKRSLTANKLKSALWTWNIYRQQEGLSIIRSTKYFLIYALRGIRKYSL